MDDDRSIRQFALDAAVRLHAHRDFTKLVGNPSDAVMEAGQRFEKFLLKPSS